MILASFIDTLWTERFPLIDHPSEIAWYKPLCVEKFSSDVFESESLMSLISNGYMYLYPIESSSLSPHVSPEAHI